MDYGYLLGMFALGIGSVPMCLILYRYRLTLAWLALWGAIGYMIFRIGFFLGLLGQKWYAYSGMEPFGKDWSLYFLGIAALWEITFGAWLLIKRKS